jgi:hypothetical protein
VVAVSLPATTSRERLLRNHWDLSAHGGGKGSSGKGKNRKTKKSDGRGAMIKRELVLLVAVWIVYHTQTLGTGTCSICRPAKSRSSVYGLLRLRGGRASPPRSMAAKRSMSETKTASTKKKERKRALPRSSGNAEQAKDDEEAIRQELMATFGDMKVNITSSKWVVCTDTCTETCFLDGDVLLDCVSAWRTCHDVAPHVCN